MTIDSTQGPSATLPQIIAGRTELSRPRLIRLMQQDQHILKDTEAALNDMGFRRFHFLASGGTGFALDTTENQVVRVTMKRPSERGDRPEHPAILRAISSRIITTRASTGKKHSLEIIIEVLPKVRTEGVTEEHIRMLEGALAKSGLSVQDIRKQGNVALIEVGGREVPVLLDAGMVRKDNRQAESGTDHLKPWLRDDGTWLQRQYEPRTTPSNVVDGPALSRMESVLRGPRPLHDQALGLIGVKRDSRRQSETIKAIIEDGMHPDQLAALYERAAARPEVKGVTFSDRLREERDAMRKEQAAENNPGGHSH
jgi:hypothetical protein